jgi:hypothetical protein
MNEGPCDDCGCDNESGRCECREEALANLVDEASIVVVMLDELADQIGDEAVFHRCRQRLRVAVAKVRREGVR